MTNTGILIITIGVILVTIIICVTNFFCNYYNDWKSEKMKDARKTVIAFKKAHVTYKTEANVSASAKDILDFIKTLEELL